MLLVCCAVTDRCDAFAAQHKDEDSENSKDVSVREANKLSRNIRKNIVEKAIATCFWLQVLCLLVGAPLGPQHGHLPLQSHWCANQGPGRCHCCWLPLSAGHHDDGRLCHSQGLSAPLGSLGLLN